MRASGGKFLFFYSISCGNNSSVSNSDPRDRNTSLPTLHEIFTYMGAISLAVIAVALMVAFNKHARRLSYKIWKFSARPYIKLLRRLGVKSERIPSQPMRASTTLGSMEIDLEKQAAADADKARASRLSTLSRTQSKKDWEEELRAQREILGEK